MAMIGETEMSSDDRSLNENEDYNRIDGQRVTDVKKKKQEQKGRFKSNVNRR